MAVDYKAYPVLYVDDETANLVALRYALEEEFTILTTSSPEEALRILREEPVAVLLADQRMPGMTGVEVCEQARDIRPEAVRIIITAYADLHAAVDAINRGGVTRYVAKPYRNEELAQVLRSSIDIVQMGALLREMHGRLIHSGQSATVLAVQRELAHEVGNLLQPLKQATELMGDLLQGAREGLQTSPAGVDRFLAEALEAHSDMETGVSRLDGVVERLRRGENTQAGDRCDVARVVQSTVRILRYHVEDGINVRAMVEAEPTAAIDATSLAQVVVNLLTNAAHALGETDAKEPTITVRVSSVAGRPLVSVTDNGPGIPEERRERIFDAQFTTKSDGQGLGLAIAKRMIEDAGGTLSVESHPGRETTFYIELATAG